MTPLFLLVAALSGFVVNVALTPLIIKVAHSNRWYDERNHRKIHTEDTPRLGGVGIFWGVLVGLVAVVILGGSLDGQLPLPLGADTNPAELLLYLLPLLGGALIVHLMGLVDDFRNLRARTKFAIHLVAALLVTLGPFRLERLTIPFIWYDLELGLFSYPVTILWVAGVSNALNFIDGVDGLAGGTAAIASCFFTLIALLSGQLLIAMIGLAILGSVVAFLVYNAPPARIFMGDSGAYLLGFLLSLFPLLLASGTGNSLDLVPAFTILAVPLVDTVTSMVRRLSRGKHPFSADREHLHHKLMDAGYGTWQLLLVAYAASVILGLTATGWYLLPVNVDMAVTLLVWAIGSVFFVRIARASR